jgi:hypothetical protein
VKKWVKVTLVTLILGVAAMALGPILWPLAEGGAQPTPGQLFFFIVLEVIQSLAFGLGVSFLLFELPTVLLATPPRHFLGSRLVGVRLLVGFWIV